MDALLPNSRTQGGAEPGFGLRRPSSKAFTGHQLAKVRVPDGPPTGPTETAGLCSPSSLGVWAGALVRHSTRGLHIIALSLRLVGKRGWTLPKPHISGLGLTGRVCAPQGRQAPPSAQYRRLQRTHVQILTQSFPIVRWPPHRGGASSLSSTPRCCPPVHTLEVGAPPLRPSRQTGPQRPGWPCAHGGPVLPGEQQPRPCPAGPAPGGFTPTCSHLWTFTHSVGSGGARRTHRQLPARKSLFASLASQPCPRPSQGAPSLWVHRVAAAMVLQRER